MKKGLADEGDVLVRRKKTVGGLSIKEKCMNDVRLLVNALKNNVYVPRILLKNGKKSKDK